MNAAALCTTLQQAVPPLRVLACPTAVRARAHTNALPRRQCRRRVRHRAERRIRGYRFRRRPRLARVTIGEPAAFPQAGSAHPRRMPDPPHRTIPGPVVAPRSQQRRARGITISGCPGGSSRLGSLVHASQPGGPKGCRRVGRVAQRP